MGFKRGKHCTWSQPRAFADATETGTPSTPWEGRVCRQRRASQPQLHAACQLPPLRKGVQAPGPQHPARGRVTMLATLPSGCWVGVGTSRPCLWARSSLPQSLPAALCPAFLASPAAPDSCRAGGRMFPQRYTAQEFTLSPGLSRLEPSALRAHTSRVCSQRRRQLSAGGFLDGTPHTREAKGSPLWMSDKGQRGSCTSGSRGQVAPGAWRDTDVIQVVGGFLGVWNSSPPGV